MNDADLEQRLRDVLAADAARLPASEMNPGDLRGVATRSTAPRRRARIVTALAAAVVIVAVAAVGVVGHRADGRPGASSVTSSTAAPALAPVRITDVGAGSGPQSYPGCELPSPFYDHPDPHQHDPYGTFRVIREGTTNGHHWTVAYQVGSSLVHFTFCQMTSTAAGQGSHATAELDYSKPSNLVPFVLPGTGSDRIFGSDWFMAVLVPEQARRVEVVGTAGERLGSLTSYDEKVGPGDRVAAGTFSRPTGKPNTPAAYPAAVVSYDAAGHEIYRMPLE